MRACFDWLVLPRRVFAAAAFVLLAPRASDAQVIGGRVLDRTTRLPARLVAVRVLGDSGVVLGQTSTDTTGIFYVQLDAPARVRLQFLIGGGDSFTSDSLSVGADDFNQHEYLLAIPRTYSDIEVEKQVSQIRGTARIVYPLELKSQHISGEVLASFVVDTLGRMEPETFRVLRATDWRFVPAVLEGLRPARFNPAEVRGRKVRQLVQQPFTFTVTSDSRVVDANDLAFPPMPRMPGGRPPE